MKAVVQKPIQSLHSFGCHDYRGRCAALPLISQSMLIIFMVTIFFANAVVAQQQDATGAKVDEKRLDLLFDRIMETLPDDEQTRVDSAASIKVDRRNNPSLSETRQHETVPVHTRLQELPDELKVQVERAIEDMEQRKEERKTQFRESRRKKDR